MRIEKYRASNNFVLCEEMQVNLYYGYITRTIFILKRLNCLREDLRLYKPPIKTVGEMVIIGEGPQGEYGFSYQNRISIYKRLGLLIC